MSNWRCEANLDLRPGYGHMRVGLTLVHCKAVREGCHPLSGRPPSRNWNGGAVFNAIRTALQGGCPASCSKMETAMYVGCSLHHCAVGPCRAKARQKKASSELCPSYLRQVLGIGTVEFLNACTPTNMPAHTCNRNGYIRPVLFQARGYSGTKSERAFQESHCCATTCLC